MRHATVTFVLPEGTDEATARTVRDGVLAALEEGLGHDSHSFVADCGEGYVDVAFWTGLTRRSLDAQLAEVADKVELEIQDWDLD